MYANIKSCIMYNNGKSDLFACIQCVRQGENLHSFLFSIFLNDLEDYFEELNDLPLGTITEKIQNTLHTFIQILFYYILMTPLFFSESLEGMQKALNIFQEYCNLWK